MFSFHEDGFQLAVVDAPKTSIVEKEDVVGLRQEVSRYLIFGCHVVDLLSIWELFGPITYDILIKEPQRMEYVEEIKVALNSECYLFLMSPTIKYRNHVGITS